MWGRCGKVRWGVGKCGGGVEKCCRRCGECVGVWGEVWKSVGEGVWGGWEMLEEVWKSVLGCKGKVRGKSGKK